MVEFSKYARAFDKLQRSNRFLGFGYAVIKKYSEDQGGYQAALLTYYGFLSLFPLLLILTTLAQWLPGSESQLRAHIISGATNYFPIIGSQLQHSVHGFSKTGLPLIIGLLVLGYGARGVADAFRNTVNHVWRVPIRERSGLLPSLGKSFIIVFGGGAGLLGAAIIASYGGAAGHDYGLRILFLGINLLLLFGSLLLVIKTAIAKRLAVQDVWIGAATATVGLFVLQNLGGYIITHELKNLNTLYGAFAVILGLLFWLYLQTQLVVYAMEVDTVRVLRLWPRHLLEPSKSSKK